MNKSQYIGITENRLNHTIAVARKCYALAKDEYHMSEEDSRKMFLLGFLHDMGYEFSENTEEHPHVASDILDSLSKQDLKDIVFAVRTHGKPQKFLGTYAQAILNEADLMVNHLGQNVSMEERCEDIRKRYGDTSHQYFNSVQMIEQLQDYKAREKAC